jgi:4-amino-4-deoxy-L-arabinose transferase-like glycosyltransferase
MISYAGIQEDEALFSIPFYSPIPREYKIRTSHHDIPLMVMSYVGALKTWIYWPLVQWFGPSVWTVRLPVALAGAITVFIFYHLIRNSGGPRAVFAASAGALLLATDPVFLLTNTYDWGPVAIEHVLLVGGCYLLLRFAKARSEEAHSRVWRLVFGFMCFGLALWNKALFVWALTGLAVAAVTTCRHEIRQCLTLRTAGIALASFLFGALPFVVFNLRADNATVSENAHLDLDHLPQKWLQLERAADGSSLFAFMVDEDADAPVKPPYTWRGRLAELIRRVFGEHRETWFFSVFGVILACGPLWWRSRAARFSLVFLVVAWSMMAVTRNAGGAAHHDILLWPFPILFAVSALAQIPWRWLAVSAAAAMVLANLLVVNQYTLQFERDGAAENFTDALFALQRALPENQTVYVIDWGMNATSQLSHQGRLDIHYAHGPLSSHPPDADSSAQLRSMLADSGAIWVDHVASREAFQGTGAILEKFASAAGYRREVLQTVADSNGRPVFEIFCFRAG